MTMDYSKLYKPYRHLESGKVYKIAQSFRDYDGKTHNPCENMLFIGYSYLAHDAGLTLVFEKDGGEYTIRLQDYKESQGDIIQKLEEYVVSQE
jgi:hypothetical protein